MNDNFIIHSDRMVIVDGILTTCYFYIAHLVFICQEKC